MQDQSASSHVANPSLFDVIIVGAGPVGLFLACELRLSGVSVLVLERAEDPHSPLKRLPFGMRGLSVPTLEAFDRRGLLDDLVSLQNHLALQNGAMPAAHKTKRHVGHFAGIPFDYDKIDASRWSYRLPSPADGNMAVELEKIETVLANRASALGVEIRRGLAVEDFVQSAESVTVHAGDHSFTGRWLIGCDGGRSIVRKRGGFQFAGTDPEFTGYSVQVDIVDPDKIKLGRHLTSTGMYYQTQPGHFGMLEFDGGAAHRAGQLTLEHVQGVLRRISQTDVSLSALHVGTSWTDRAQQATAYRKGRVLLAGDAAHIHSPLGGQGLNLGLGDAMNLGWKLAATIRGEAPDGLLDSYFAERHPIGAKILDWSRAQVSIMRPTPHSRAMEAIIRDLIDTRDGATYFAERVWNVSLRYELDDSHALVGRSAPDFELTDGTRLAVLMREGKALLLDFDGCAPLKEVARRLGGTVKYFACRATDQMGLRALLIRPDGVVIYACESVPDPKDVEEAASRWFCAMPASSD